MAFSSQSFTAPKIGKGNISSPLSSGASRITKTAPKLRVNRINLGNKRTISSPALEAQSSIENTLSETNAILVEIQKQLSLDFSMRIADEKEKNKTFKEEKSRKKLISKESSIESIKKIGGAIKKIASVVAAPVSGFFDKILEFITTLGLGIGANAVLTWFEDEENRKKIGTFFKILTANWKLLRNILGVIIGAGLALKVANAVAIIGKTIALLASGPGLAVIGGVLLAMGAVKAAEHFRKIKEKRALEEEVSVGAKDPSKIGGDDGMTFEEYKIFNYMEPGFEGLQDATVDPRIEKNKQLREKVFSPDYDPMDDTPQIIQREKTFGERVGDVFRPVQNFIYGGARAMGGPVTAGQSYLVGEGGPEIFSPNINGSIVNNKRTQTILNGSKNKGKVNFLTMDLPPIQMNKGKPGPTPPAPEVPQISSTNSADLWRMKTPEIYGIYV